MMKFNQAMMSKTYFVCVEDFFFRGCVEDFEGAFGGIFGGRTTGRERISIPNITSADAIAAPAIMIAIAVQSTGAEISPASPFFTVISNDDDVM